MASTVVRRERQRQRPARRPSKSAGPSSATRIDERTVRALPLAGTQHPGLLHPAAGRQRRTARCRLRFVDADHLDGLRRPRPAPDEHRRRVEQPAGRRAEPGHQRGVDRRVPDGHELLGRVRARRRRAAERGHAVRQQHVHGSAYLFTRQTFMTSAPFLQPPGTPKPDLSRYNIGAHARRADGQQPRRSTS